MDELKPFRLVPNPGGDRKAFEFEFNLLDLLEEGYEVIASQSTYIQWLADHVMEGVPVDHIALEKAISDSDDMLSAMARMLERVRSRKTIVQQQLTALKG